MAAGKGAEIRAGIVMIAGLAILAVGLFLVSGGSEQFIERARYTIYFEDAGGIKGGDDVKLSGQHVGSVASVDEKVVRKDGRNQRLVGVTIEIYADKVIEPDARFMISQTITGIVSMSILHGASSARADDRTELFGDKVATFEEAIGNANALLADAREIVAEMKAAAVDVRAIVAQLREKGIAEDADAFMEKINRAADSLVTILADAKSPVGDTLEHARTAAANLKDVTANVRDEGWPKIHERLQTILENIRAASEKLDAMLAENRPDLRLAIQNFKDATLRIAPTLERIERLAKSADETVADVRPRLVAMIDNARKAMENFKGVTEDLKTAPWKLVNKPSDKEGREVHLYAAARLYVSAAEEVGFQVDQLESLQKSGAFADEARKADLESALASLRTSLGDYDRREKELLELLKSGAGKH